MTRQIKPSTSTQFPVGSKVKITNSGHCYSTYKDMAQYLGIEDTYKWGKNPFNQGDIGVVVARATHETSSYGEVFAVKVGDKVGMIGYRGLVEHEELKPILFDEMREGQVVRFTKFKGHEHWDFVVGKDYTVECDEYGYTGHTVHTGPRDRTGSIPSCKWGDWEWVLVSEAPQTGKGRLPQYELAPLGREVKELTQYFATAPEWATHVGSDSQGVYYFDHHPHIYKSSFTHEVAFLKGLLPSSHRYKSLYNSYKVGATDTLKVALIPRATAPQEPTIDEVKAELATVKAKLWEAEQKLAKIKAAL